MNQFAPTIIFIASIFMAATMAAAAAYTILDELKFKGVGILFWFSALLFPLLLAAQARRWGSFVIGLGIYLIIVIAPAGVITMLSLFDIKRKEASKR